MAPQEGIKLPFRVLPVVSELGRTRLDVQVKIKGNFDVTHFALNVIVTVPVPDNTAKADIQTSQGASIGKTSPPCSRTVQLLG